MVTSESYDEYKQEYNVSLGRIRSYLAGSTRSRSVLQECDRLLSDAKRCATAMQAMAEIEGNGMRVQESKHLLERDIAPLSREIQRQLYQYNNLATTAAAVVAVNNTANRQELFYQAPDIERNNEDTDIYTSSDLEALITSSDDLLRDSQSILAETEEIGTRTLHQMGRQREQFENARNNLTGLQAASTQANRILRSMACKAWKSKIALYSMIFVLASANLYVLYCIYNKNWKKH